MGIFANGQIGFSGFGVIGIVVIVSRLSSLAATKAMAWGSGLAAYRQQAEGYCRAGNLAAARSAMPRPTLGGATTLPIGGEQ